MSHKEGMMLGQDRFFQEALRFVRQHTLAKEGDRILVAISGGVDSTVLGHVLARASRLLKVDVEFVHVNHSTRGETSAREGVWVKVLGDRLNIKTHLLTLPVLAKPSQAALRDLRRANLMDLLEEREASSIATAHHADDNAETFLMRAVSGTGSSGLAGIKPKEDVWIRPLLFATRAEIEDYARNFRLAWVEDPTNEQRLYLRNQLRHDALPLLESIRQGAVGNIAKLAARIEEEEREWSEWIERQMEGPKEALSRAWLERWPDPLQRRIFKVWLGRLGIEYDAALVEALVNGDELVHSTGTFLRRSDMYLFSPEVNFGKAWENPRPIELGKKIDLGISSAWSFLKGASARSEPTGFSLFFLFRPPTAMGSASGMNMAWDKLPWPLALRARQSSDSEAEIDRILAKQKVPRPFWKHWPLVVSAQQPETVVAVAGVGALSRFVAKDVGRCVCMESFFNESLKPLLPS